MQTQLVCCQLDAVIQGNNASTSTQSNWAKWNWAKCRPVLFTMAVLVTFLSLSPQATAQSNNLPRREYYSGKAAFYNGKFRVAAKLFRSASSGYKRGTQQGTQLWVDAVCSYTMLAECNYQIGNFEAAIENYRNALDVFLANQGWLERVTFPATQETNEVAINRAKINWGTTSRKGAIARVNPMQVLFGNRNPLNNIQNGGAIVQPEHRIADVAEIMKCAAHAMARRRELMGPLTQHAPYSRTLTTATEATVLNNHPYAMAWTQLLHGISLASSKEYQKAEQLLLASAQAKGYDHPLTPIALFEMGNLHAEQGKLKTALGFYLETTFSAALFEQWEIFSQAFERAFKVHLVVNGPVEYSPLARIFEWERFRNLPDAVRCNLLLMGAEAKIEAGQVDDAAKFLDLAKKFIDSETARSQLAARYYFHLAQINALAGNVTDCYANVSTAVQTYSGSSRRLFQIGKALQLDTSGSVTQRTAGEIYSVLLNEPTGSDWVSSPLEALTLLLSPLQAPRQRWFQIAMGRKEYEKGIEIADNIRRFQFYNAMPLGGRLLAFRWMMEAPANMISPETAEQKKVFNLAYPDYQELSQQAKQIQQDLDKIVGLPAIDTDDGKRQEELLVKLTENSERRDWMFLNAALKRNAAPMSFPPKLKFGELQDRMSEKQAAWIFFLNGNQYYSFFLTKDTYRLDKVIPATVVQRQLPNLLKKMGNSGVRMAPVSQKVLEENGWKKPATELMKFLEPKDTNWENYDELVIVPDGPLWYLPFDVLQVGEGETENLGSKVPIRFAPTVSTIVPDGRKVKPIGKSLVVAGRLTRNQDKDFTAGEIEKLKQVMPDVTVLDKRINFDSASFSSQIDTLIVWDEIEQSEKMVGLEWEPLQVDRGKPRSNVISWMGLPFKGPEQFIIPGFHTQAGSGRLRGNGSEIFLTVCGMMATGARTVLISRWAVGGENDYQLTRNFAAEIRTSSAVNAWQKAKEMAALNDINAEKEPRIRTLTGDNPLKTDHPFFWSGYLLVDTGAKPTKDAPKQ